MVDDNAVLRLTAVPVTEMVVKLGVIKNADDDIVEKDSIESAITTARIRQCVIIFIDNVCLLSIVLLMDVFFS